MLLVEYIKQHCISARLTIPLFPRTASFVVVMSFRSLDSDDSIKIFQKNYSFLKKSPNFLVA